MEGDHLLGGAIILVLVALRLVIAVSAFIAYADGVGVVVLGVATLDAEGATVVEGAVTGHVKVITGVLAEAFALVARLEFLDGEALARLCVRAVQHDQLNLPGIRRSLPIRAQPGQQCRP